MHPRPDRSLSSIMEHNINTNPFIAEQEENEPEAESPPSTTSYDMKIASTHSPKRGRRSRQNRVVSVPIKDVEGSRLKGDTAPPSDSWAWRKYGQKPIKGSPYPRGYYRCSSSKGCPARKQVERSRDDPSMIVITYTCEHNHPWPASRNSHKHHPKTEPEPESTVPEPEREPEVEHEEKFADHGEMEAAPSLLTSITVAACGDEFAWFGEMKTTSSTILESPIFSERRSVVGDTSAQTDVAMLFQMGEEDESLFADLGELPECSVDFRFRNVGPQVEIC